MSSNVTIYLADVTPSTTHVDRQFLSEEEIHRIDCQNDETKKNQMERRFFLRREILASHLGLKLSEVNLETIGGAPKLISQTPIFFSTSYSDQFIALAIAPHPVGIDLEKRHENKRNAHVALMFHPQEQRALDKAENFNDVFYTIWSQKEAFLKASGLAKKLELEKFVVTPEGGIVRLIDGIERSEVWYANMLTWKSDFALAVAGPIPDLNTDLIEWTIS